MIVFLVGFMGSGKTSIGKGLAKQLNCAFIDSDDDIEIKEKRSIEEIFKCEGEAYFRNLEYEWLLGLNEKMAVVSVGGGLPCFNDNMSIMLQRGVVIYLTLPIEMMANRLINAKTIRPLIEPYKDDFEALLDFMRDLLSQRDPFYSQADILFEASNMTSNKKQLLEKMVNKSFSKKGRSL